jgi:hypothetical protein
MRLSEILTEAPDQGWLTGSDIEVEVIDYSTSEVKLVLGIGEDADIVVDAHIDVDARVEDHSFGYEYGSISGTHEDYSHEGEISVKDIDLDIDDRSTTKKAAQLLRVPGRQSLNPVVLQKYLYHAFKGGEQAFTSFVETYIDETLGEDLINSEIESRKDDY